MTNSPRLENRPAIRYVAIGGSGSGERELWVFADATFPASRLAEPAASGATAAAFMRFFRYAPNGDFEA
jgi:hypothetical protein